MDKTLAILKPDCVERKLTGKALDFILARGFNILTLKMVHLSPAEARRFYAVHEGKSFFDELINFMTSCPCIPLVLEKENAVFDFRKIIGATDPAKAAKDTLRKLYAESVQRNAVHGSDSEENAQKEIAFFFSLMEITS